jgi:anti-anti-sigma factor
MGSFLTRRTGGNVEPDDHGAGAFVEDGERSGQMILDIFGVTSYAVEGGRVVSLRGELDASTVPGLAEELASGADSLVVLDLNQLTFIDSSGLGAIHVARQRVINDGGVLVVCRPSPAVHRVLEITGLDIWLADWDPAWSDPSAPT